MTTRSNTAIVGVNVAAMIVTSICMFRGQAVILSGVVFGWSLFGFMLFLSEAVRAERESK